MSGIFKGYNYSGVAGTILCGMIQSGPFTVLAAYGGRACVIIHTLDRYWKIVHPIHHRKHYRPWMVKVGIALPWLLGFLTKSVMAIETTRIVNGRCIPRSWPSDFALQVSLRWLEANRAILTLYISCCFSAF